MTITLLGIRRYPVKSLSAEVLETAELQAGGMLPGDRRFALAHGTTNFDPFEPQWQPKTNFLNLMENPRLALLDTQFNEDDGTLSVHRNSKRVAWGRITTPIGRTIIEDFFAAFMRGEVRGRPRLLQAPGFAFSDTPRKWVSILSLASLEDLARVIGKPVNPARFRANLHLEGGIPWEETAWIGREIAIGTARLRIEEAFRCSPSVEVNPANGQRDMGLLAALERGFGRKEMGIFASVIADGTIAAGDAVTIAEE